MLFCHLVLSFATCYFISYSLLVLSLVLFLKFPSLPGATGSSQNSTQEQFPHWLAKQLTTQSKNTHRGDLLRYTKQKASAASTLACKATHKRARATSTLACKATHTKVAVEVNLSSLQTQQPFTNHIRTKRIAGGE